jgi:predicted SAM-dependent methyltransferase/ADP-heptose:LPS heptosyltransferase
MTWRAEDPQGNEAYKVRWDIVRWTRGKGLDLGAGPFKAWPHFISVDNGHHWGFEGVNFPVETCEDLSVFSDESQPFVFSSHLLEHIEDTGAALAEWYRVIKTGGYLILYLPHKVLYPNMGEEGANPDHKHDFLPEDIIEHMKAVGGWDLLINETRDTDNGPGERGNEYSFYQVFRKRGDDIQRRVCDEPKPDKTVCVCRFGAYGDQLQASSVLKGLKEQGYHWMTVPTGYAVLRTNPYIDEWFLMDVDQVPDTALTGFWNHWRTKFDKFINLSESIERTLLAVNWDSRWDWPKSVLHRMMDQNYLEFTHELAEVPFVPDVHFYETDAEQEESEAFRAEKATGFCVLWALAGSSLHKFYPWMDQVLAAVMLHLPEAKVVTVGDAACAILEQGWEDEDRVITRSGQWSMRRSLSMALHSDLVMGPETGVLNAVGYEEVETLIMLSHSSEKNLTRDWVNNTVMVPDTAIAPCYPCHKLHHSKSTCPREEETTAAMCAASINPDDVFNAIRASYESWADNRRIQATG